MQPSGIVQAGQLRSPVETCQSGQEAAKEVVGHFQRRKSKALRSQVVWKQSLARDAWRAAGHKQVSIPG